MERPISNTLMHGTSHIMIPYNSMNNTYDVKYSFKMYPE